MNEIPESKFGIRDVIAIVIFLVVLPLMFWLLPDQVWLTESIVGLKLVRVGVSIFIAALSWFATLKFLIPSDEEIIDLDVKRQIAGGIREIKEDAATIKSTGYGMTPAYSDQVIQLGETIERIANGLGSENLTGITKIEGKLFRFVNLLKIFAKYDSGDKRNTAAKMTALMETFESALKLTITAMDNLEFNLTDTDLSKAKVLEKTLEDLYEMDGLLQSTSSREESDQVKNRSSDE